MRPVFCEQNLRQKLEAARPREIGWNGTGGWVTPKHFRQANFSRTCWITLKCAGTYSSVFGDVLSKLAQRAATTWTLGSGRMHKPLGRQVRRQGPARGSFALPVALSILHAEFSITQVLAGRILFEQVIRENLDIGRTEEVQLIFQRRITKRTPGSFRTRIVTEGVTPTLNVHYKTARIKQYHKEQRALRTETTINQRQGFGIGKRLHNLPSFREIAFAANRRLLDAERLSHDRILAKDSFRTINGPVEQNGQRADPRIQFLWKAILLFRLRANGFRAADLRQHLAALSGRNPSDISQGALTYQLRRLQLHGIIEKVANNFRYRITASGFRAALFFTRAYNRLLRPGLAAALPDHHETGSTHI